jgi:hypothetical protein
MRGDGMTGDGMTERSVDTERAPDDVFLDRLAKRIADALYYGSHEAIGINGSVSPGLLHDDYDRLRSMAKQMRIEKLRAALAAEEAS